MDDPEGDGEGEPDEEGKTDEVVGLSVCKELLAECAHRDGRRVVALDNPTAPLRGRSIFEELDVKNGVHEPHECLRDR